jgi:hypothetical protein
VILHDKWRNARDRNPKDYEVRTPRHFAWSKDKSVRETLKVAVFKKCPIWNFAPSLHKSQEGWVDSCGHCWKH